ncbi:MAG TPA: DUF885 domain-containing protein [Gemmatimonadales bacterium]|nr:DUF885 domain-containing protein [Gemmatimonadales bacterium]
MLTACVSDPAPRFGELVEEIWQFQLREDPLLATSVGDGRYNDRLPSVTVADQDRRAEARRSFVARLEAVDRARLSAADQLNYDVLLRQLRDELTDHEFQSYLLPITADWGFHMGIARLPDDMPLVTARDYEHYIGRLAAVREYVDQHIALMRRGVEMGFTQPRVVLQGYDATARAHVVADPRTSVFYRPFAAFPTTVPQAERSGLEARGREAIVTSVIPAYRALAQFLTEEYLPGARTTIGASEWPNGRAYYGHLVEHYTTLPLTPEAVHQTGLDEVARIRTDMEEVMGQVRFRGSFAEFLRFLRTDSRFYARTPDELLKEASFIAKRMDGKLPSLFKTLPRLPYGVAPVPDEIAPKFTAGRYIGAPVGSRQPGYYWVNTYALSSRPLYALEALTLHEAVPGHHLQIALAQELTGLPPFRRFADVTAFTEGWGLYAEWLGTEAGFYQDPYRRFGRLTYEMWRACRLVVDTGMHALGWSRERAMEFMAQNTALSLHEVRTEIDRYISWPGQALAYKLGELKIRQLRREAEQALGAGFDVRDFHDVVLRNGAIPLSALETQVRAYLAR